MKIFKQENLSNFMPLFGRPWWSFLPGGSFNYFAQNYSDWNFSKFRECVHGYSHLLYAFGTPFAAIGLLTSTLCNYPETKTLNPLSQQSFYKQKEIETKQKEEKCKDLTEKIFGPGGYADINFDKKIDIIERAYALKKIGLDNFPKEDLSLEQLEELVKKYE